MEHNFHSNQVIITFSFLVLFPSFLKKKIVLYQYLYLKAGYILNIDHDDRKTCLVDITKTSIELV